MKTPELAFYRENPILPQSVAKLAPQAAVLSQPSESKGDAFVQRAVAQMTVPPRMKVE